MSSKTILGLLVLRTRIPTLFDQLLFCASPLLDLVRAVPTLWIKITEPYFSTRASKLHEHCRVAKCHRHGKIRCISVGRNIPNTSRVILQLQLLEALKNSVRLLARLEQFCEVLTLY